MSVGVAPLSCVALISTAEDDQERPPKGPVQKGVEEGVQPRVNVAEPQPCCPQLPGHRVVDERVHNIGDEEWSPTQAETAHDDRQRLCCLGLNSHATVGHGRLLGGRGRCCSQAIVRQRVGGCGQLHRDCGSRAGDRSRASPLQCLDLTHVGHGSHIDALVG